MFTDTTAAEHKRGNIQVPRGRNSQQQGIRAGTTVPPLFAWVVNDNTRRQHLALHTQRYFFTGTHGLRDDRYPQTPNQSHSPRIITVTRKAVDIVAVVVLGVPFVCTYLSRVKENIGALQPTYPCGRPVSYSLGGFMSSTLSPVITYTTQKYRRIATALVFGNRCGDISKNDSGV